MLEEKAKRRPEFDEANSVPVRFPGGSTWYLPKPMVRLRPVFRDGKRVDEAILTTGDLEFDRLKDMVAAATRDESLDFGGAVTDVAAYMLLKNYALSDQELGLIFCVPLGDEPPTMTWMAEVMAIAHGRSPKVSSGGDA